MITFTSVCGLLSGRLRRTVAQDIADLGIGFLQNYSGEGLTGADMPNGGDATYSGNWAGTVRAMRTMTAMDRYQRWTSGPCFVGRRTSMKAYDRRRP